MGILSRSQGGLLQIVIRIVLIAGVVIISSGLKRGAATQLGCPWVVLNRIIGRASTAITVSEGT